MRAGDHLGVAQASHRRRGTAGSRCRGLSFGVVVRDVRDAFVDHNLLTYAAAASFQAILALIPLFLLGLALLGRSASAMSGLLALGGYLFMSVGIFFVGAQLDETLRREKGGRARGMLRGWF